MIPTIIDEYLGRRSDGQAKREAFQELMGDVIMHFPVLEFSRNLHGKPIPVYLPHLSHLGPGAGLSQATWPHTSLLPPHPTSSLGCSVRAGRGDSGRELRRGENQSSERGRDLSEFTLQGPVPISGFV